METEKAIYVKHIKKALNEDDYDIRALQIIKDVIFGLLSYDNQLKRQVDLTSDLFFNKQAENVTCRNYKNTKGGKE